MRIHGLLAVVRRPTRIEMVFLILIESIQVLFCDLLTYLSEWDKLSVRFPISIPSICSRPGRSFDGIIIIIISSRSSSRIGKDGNGMILFVGFIGRSIVRSFGDRDRKPISDSTAILRKNDRKRRAQEEENGKSGSHHEQRKEAAGVV